MIFTFHSDPKRSPMCNNSPNEINFISYAPSISQ